MLGCWSSVLHVDIMYCHKGHKESAGTVSSLGFGVWTLAFGELSERVSESRELEERISSGDCDGLRIA